MRLIDADMAIDALKELTANGTNKGMVFGEDAVHRIEMLPPAQPERKGKWINEGRIIRCNRCKIGYATVKGMKSALTYNFCPNCGADMRGEQDG